MLMDLGKPGVVTSHHGIPRSFTNSGMPAPLLVLSSGGGEGDGAWTQWPAISFHGFGSKRSGWAQGLESEKMDLQVSCCCLSLEPAGRGS